MSLQDVVQQRRMPQQQPQQLQQQPGNPEQVRAVKNAMLLQKLQQMPPEQRQMVISMAQRKRRERLQAQAQGQPNPPQGQPNPAPNRPAMPVQGRPRPPQWQPNPLQGVQVNPQGFRRMAMGQRQPSLAELLQQKPRVGMGG